MPYHRPAADQSSALLAAAQEAASKGDAHGLIQALFTSGFMDGLVARLTAQWGRQLGQAEIRDVVAAAIDKAFDAVKSGKVIKNLGGWIWKAASREITDRWRDDHQQRVTPTSIDNTHSRAVPITDGERVEIDRHRDQCRDEAITTARRLLAKVGEGQVRNVMTLLIDAVEQGVPDLPPSQIADTLGISEDSVRTLLSRGFKRLDRAAREEGIEWPDSIAPDDLDEIEAFHNHHHEHEDSRDAE